MNFDSKPLRLYFEPLEVNWKPVEGSKIVEFYKNKTVFVTGGTGFLGKLLVEKLLRSCPDINKVYLLVRPKKGEDEIERVDKICSDQLLFGPLAAMYPKFKHKINTLKGDVGLPDLGLNPSDISLIQQEVNVIIHLAATVRFDEKLSKATHINVRGTRDLLTISKKCKNLESFVHVSTAYSNCRYEEIQEILYKQPLTADELIEMVDNVPEDVLEERTPTIIKGWPNTYTFTKAIAEDGVAHYGKGLPICVVRPAIVIATYKEPLRIWVDNLYGAMGLMVGGGIGLVKALHCDSQKSAEFVPGDYVINKIIAASYKTAQEKNDKNIAVYNYVSSVENRMTWEDTLEFGSKWLHDTPTMKSVWYYCLILNKYYFVHALYKIFLHFLPAVFIDLGMILSGKKAIMWKIYKKIDKFNQVLSYFTLNEWKFHNDNTQKLYTSLSPADQQMFPFSMKTVDWDEYYCAQVVGLRLNVLKDDISTIPQAKIRWRRFYLAHQTVKAVFCILILYAFYAVLSTFLV